jgi:restriction system protein
MLNGSQSRREKMTKKEKNNLFTAIAGTILMIGIWILYKYDLSWHYLFGLLLLVTIIPSLIIRGIPDKKKKSKYKNNKKGKSNNSTRISNFRLLSDSKILQLNLTDISAIELERLCYLYYKSKGYRPELTKSGADGGIDLIYYHPEVGKTAVQIKHYIHSKNQISVEKIRELNSAKRNYDCVFSEFITTSTFTLPALSEAPKSMNMHDIYWFNSNVIPWMKKERLKYQKSS